MKVLVGEKEYWIEFEHSETGPRILEATRCYIRDASGGHTTDRPPVIALGVARRYYRDTPNREVGRKAALKKALEDLDNSVEVPLLHHLKARRRLFWEAYLGRKRQGSAKKSGVTGGEA